MSDILVGAAVKTGSGPDFLQQDNWWDVDISKNWLDVTKEYKKPKYLFRINNVECFPLGGVQGITGQAGSGKTQTMAMLIAAALGDKSHCIEYCLVDDKDIPIPMGKVLYIDTEMEEGNTQLVNRRICAMLNWDYRREQDNLKLLRLRDELTAADRWRKILKAIYEMGKDRQLRLAIIDGLIDIIGDFNDNKECQEIIFKTMALAEHYQISLCLVLHQNPGSEKMVGHAGSFLERKATDVFQTKKEKDETSGLSTFTISQKKARGRDVPDLKFRIESDIHTFGVARVLNPLSQGTDIETIRDWIKSKDMLVQWPSHKGDILKLIFDESPDPRTDFDKAVNRNWLIKMDKCLPGEFKPRWEEGDITSK